MVLSALILAHQVKFYFKQKMYHRKSAVLIKKHPFMDQKCSYPSASNVYF